MPPHHMTPDELSSIAGWMSVASWIVVYTPQVWENYQLKSGEGLSVTFIVLWLLGDITGLIGGVLAKLVPTVIILASYYTLCDLILLFQVYYYRWTNRSASAIRDRASEESPLLERTASRTSVAQPKPLLQPYLEYPLLLLFVLSAGVGAWYLSDSKDDTPQPGTGGQVELEWKSQVLGYASAALYLGSRIPQIVHNYKTRCAGLSLAMFFFSISGNVTFVLSILLHSLESRYLLANASWLAGAGLTVFLDLFVLGQFAVFSWHDRQIEQRGKLFVNGDEIRDADNDT